MLDIQNTHIRAGIRDLLKERYVRCPPPEKILQLATEVTLRQYRGGTDFGKALDIGNEIISTYIDQQESI